MWDDRILLTGGLRLQQIVEKSYSIVTALQTGEYSKASVTPVIGLVVKPVDHISFYANRIEALVQGATAPAISGGLNIVNVGEVLPPFRSTHYEVGGKLTLNAVTASLSSFTTERATAIATALPAPPANAARFEAAGLQRNKGIELSIQAKPFDGLRIITGASVIDARLRRQTNGHTEGRKVTGVPDYLINGKVEWDVPLVRALTVNGRVVHTVEQPTMPRIRFHCRAGRASILAPAMLRWLATNR